MTPAELRNLMRARKKQLRVMLPQLRKAARERADLVPAVKAAKARRRRFWRAFGIAVIVLLLLLMRCECGPEMPPPGMAPITVVPKVTPKPKVVVKPAPKKELDGQGTKQGRGNLGVPTPVHPSWIEEFQLQVAARSPRLAKCFTGIERAGAMRWSTAVNPQSGAASDHELEPVGVSTDLSPEQRDCVVRVLSNPTYKLTAPDKEALPDRVSLVIEF